MIIISASDPRALYLGHKCEGTTFWRTVQKYRMLVLFEIYQACASAISINLLCFAKTHAHVLVLFAQRLTRYVDRATF